MVNKVSKELVMEKMAPLWSILSPEQQSFLYDQLTFRHFRKGDIIYEEGEEPTHLMCLLTGSAKIYRKGYVSRPQILRLLLPGDYFGYRAYFAHARYITHASPLEDSQVCFIPLKCISKITQENNKVANLFIELLSKDLGQSDMRSIYLTQSHISGRMAETILYLKNTCGTDPQTHALRISLPREELAALSNMTTSNAIRTLGALADDGLIVLSGRSIRIANEEKLLRVAQRG